MVKKLDLSTYRAVSRAGTSAVDTFCIPGITLGG